MAIGIANYPNIEPASADYPNGYIKDAPSGTPVNVLTNGDIQILFDKLCRVAGVTPNGLPDNETNGYQLFEALQKAARPYNTYVAELTQTGTSAPTAVVMENNLSGTPTLGYSNVGIYTLSLTGEFDASKTVAFISTRTASRVGKISRSDDDTIVILIEDDSGTSINNWSSYIEIRVYR